MSEPATDPADASPVGTTMNGTGHPTVDAVVVSLDGLEGLPPAAHVAVFESAHDRLSEALADARTPDARTPGTAGVAGPRRVSGAPPTSA